MKHRALPSAFLIILLTACAADTAEIGSLTAAVVDSCQARGLYDNSACDANCPLPDPGCGLIQQPSGSCGTFDGIVRRRWSNRIRSTLVTALGSAHHSADEPIVNLHEAATVTGRFTYGPAAKHLEGERISLFMRVAPCDSYEKIGEATTSGSGRASFTIAGSRLSHYGAYQFRMVVHGDESFVEGYVWVVAPNTKTVVFDIDGTLNSSDDLETVTDAVFDGDPSVRAGAASLVQYYADRGYLIVYLTGQGYALYSETRDWLRRKGFPRGVLHVSSNRFGASPSWDGVGRYKRDYLRAVDADPNLDFMAAYGNATTDICAYGSAGISTQSTFIIGPHAGERCNSHFGYTQSISSYASHLAAVRAAAH